MFGHFRVDQRISGQELKLGHIAEGVLGLAEAEEAPGCALVQRKARPDHLEEASFRKLLCLLQRGDMQGGDVHVWWLPDIGAAAFTYGEEE